VCERIGGAIVSASFDERPTPSALRRGLVALAFYQAHSPREAMRVLTDLGDVDFDKSDFDPQWFQPDEGIATIDLILGRTRRRFTPAVRDELVQLRKGLVEARSRGCTFYLVELEPGETVADARGHETRRKTRSRRRLTTRCTRRPPERTGSGRG
jgi:hypothetical protein